jgi:ABC-type transport system substrate-binding protein
MLHAQVFETPFSAAIGNEPSVPILFDGPLASTGGDGAVLVGKVRTGVHFSDGTALEADHIVASLERVPAIARATRVRAAGREVRFELIDREFALASALTKPWCVVTLDRDGSSLGTGPYCIADGSTSQHVRLERNRYHHGPAAPIAQVEIRAFPPATGSPGAALRAAVEAGEIDFTSDRSREEAADLHGVRKLYQPGNSTAFLWINTERLPDVRVRRAISLAIDRYAIVATSYRTPAAFVAKGPLPPRMERWIDNARTDVEAAKKLLGEPGVARVNRLRRVVVWGPRADIPDPLRWARTIAEQLAAIDIEVAIVQSRDTYDFQDKIRAGEYELVLGGWNADTDDAGDFVEALFGESMIHTRDAKRVVGCNFSRWRDAEVARAIATYQRVRDSGQLHGALARAAAEVPLVPLAHGPAVYVHAWHVSGFDPARMTLPRFAELDLRS